MKDANNSLMMRQSAT